MNDSGYRPCACRDCMEIAIGSYCHECEDAGCSDYQGVEGMSQECQSEHAYECGETTHETTRSQI